MSHFLTQLWQSPHFLTYCLGVIQVGIMIRYALGQDWPRVAYWAAVMVIVWSTTRMH